MNINNNYIIYLINLDRSKERLDKMINEFNKCNLNFNRISAVDGKIIENYKFKVNNKYTKKLLHGEIACHLSHLKTLQTFLKSDKQYAVILEDDIILDNDFKNIIEKSLINHNHLENKNKWDVLKLININRKNHKISNLDDNHFIGICGTSISSVTAGAIWTRKGAEKFLSEIIIDSIPVIKRPIDCELQFPWEYNNLLIYNILPSPIFTRHVDSEININSKKEKSSFFKRLKYERSRFFNKNIYLIKICGTKNFIKSFLYPKNKENYIL